VEPKEPISKTPPAKTPRESWLGDDEPSTRPVARPPDNIFPKEPPPVPEPIREPVTTPVREPVREPVPEPVREPVRDPEEPVATPKVDLPPKPTVVEPPMPADTDDPRRRAAALVESADLLSRSGQTAEADEKCRQALRLDPGSHSAHGLIARIAFAEERFAVAVDEAKQALQLNPKEFAYWLTLGDTYYRQARNADTEFKRQAHAGAAAEEVNRLQRQRDDLLGDARKAFGQVIRLMPGRKDGYDRLGDAVYFQARAADYEVRMLKRGSEEQCVNFYREAIQAFMQGCTVDKINYREAFHIGVSHYRLNELDPAQRYLERAIEEANQVVPKEAFWYLAEIHEKKGDMEGALRYWEKAVETYPPGRYRDRAMQRVTQIRQQSPK